MIQKYLKACRLFIFITAWFILTFSFQVSFLTSQSFAAENRVMIIRSQPITAYNEAIRGFEEGCKGKNISIQAIYDLKGDADEGERILQNIKDNHLKPNLILAVGILAATLVKDQFNDIPIIFCMVINHERFNLQGANITGISSEASVEDQFTILKEFLGTEKNIGVIYDPMKTGKIVSEAVRAAKQFELNLIPVEVQSEREVVPVFNTLVNKIDALWIIPDGTVVTKDSLEGILKGSLKHRLPTFCTSSAIVRAGALLSISTDYISTGLQAAQIAQTLLKNSGVVSLGVKQPDKLKLTLNTQTAKILGINASSFLSRPSVVLYP